MVEVGELFPEDEVFQQRRATNAVLQRILVIGNGHALVGGQHLPARVHADPVQRRDGSVHALRRHAAGLVAVVGFRQSAAANQTRRRFDRGTCRWGYAIGHTVLGFLVGIEGHGSDQTFSLRHFFSRLGGQGLGVNSSTGWRLTARLGRLGFGHGESVC